VADKQRPAYAGFVGGSFGKKSGICSHNELPCDFTIFWMLMLVLWWEGIAYVGCYFPSASIAPVYPRKWNTFSNFPLRIPYKLFNPGDYVFLDVFFRRVPESSHRTSLSLSVRRPNATTATRFGEAGLMSTLFL
jgi:hypothetical protein